MNDEQMMASTMMKIIKDKEHWEKKSMDAKLQKSEEKNK